MNGMTRGEFFRIVSAGAAATLLPRLVRGAEDGLGTNGMAQTDRPTKPVTRPEVTFAKLPRWRGFNLLEMFKPDRSGVFEERDFDIIAEWGFDFVRLPLSYHWWAKPDPSAWRNLDEKVLKQLDKAVEFGRQRGIHVSINLHRAPGYCVNAPQEPLDLWTDEQALDACLFHWAHFAQRYKGLPNKQVSFDLLNEPARVEEAQYVKVAKALIATIRAADPDRLIISDGIEFGTKPVFSLVDAKVAQSTRGYAPVQISHWGHKSFPSAPTWPRPAWPLQRGPDDLWDRARLFKENIEPWQALEAKGIGIHVGEWGCYQLTPHDVALKWMKENLDLWKKAGWGWALWNLRGTFGVLNSGRSDVAYEDFREMKLDRQMLELLKEG